MRVIILTGMSGAGKSQALKCFEDMGYYCVDNLPPDLLRTFINLYSDRMRGLGQTDGRIAINIDIRGGAFFLSVFQELNALEENGVQYEVLYLDADDTTLIKRYKESRRTHPVAGESLKVSIEKERSMLVRLRARADQIIDTTGLKVAKLKDTIKTLYGEHDQEAPFTLTVMSFGFKYGIPADADLIFDARFIDNPYYVDELKHHSGLETAVQDYVLGFEETRTFLDKLRDMLTFLIPLYKKEGKPELIIGIGCTGGMHRSVTIAQQIGLELRKEGYTVRIDHRDLKEESNR